MSIAIPDSELLEALDQTTIWIASPPGPRDIWSLRDAVNWAAVEGTRRKVTLHRPARGDTPPAWVSREQIQRLFDRMQVSSPSKGQRQEYTNSDLAAAL